MLLAVVSKGCVRRGGLRRLPALKNSVDVCDWYGVVVWLSGLECSERGAGEEVV